MATPKNALLFTFSPIAVSFFSFPQKQDECWGPKWPPFHARIFKAHFHLKLHLPPKKRGGLNLVKTRSGIYGNASI